MRTEFNNNNLSDLMVEVLSEFTKISGDEISGLSLTLGGFDSDNKVVETESIRNHFDNALKDRSMQPIRTVASTIFPYHLWKPGLGRSVLFERYQKILPHIKKWPQNKLGIYFERMIDYKDNFNQLEKIVEMYESKNRRRSAFQVSIWDPLRDMINTPLRGFPCMQHLVFSCVQNKLIVIAFYATQFVFERAYGNLLGLCNLGEFLSHELKIPLHEVKCYVGVEKLSISKSHLKETLNSI